MSGKSLALFKSQIDDQEKSRTPLLTLRLVTLVIVVAMLTSHLRSMRVFRWEHSVTGGILVTYTIGILGLALCAAVNTCKSLAFQAYLSGTGSVLMAVNAVVIYRRWRHSGDLTRVVAELLQALGVQLKRQVIIKISLSTAAAILLLIDLFVAPFVMNK
ncbi:unnamed protein product [Danaus chrysippus]|uniref:(African queen) hypothetical protein n=1 Tax=Danaus chrysippus TaxID=151541 RepID=A0A8J2Q7R0_9NEOP|nr:unnamed protein product [Danaus chrysippus]